MVTKAVPSYKSDHKSTTESGPIKVTPYYLHLEDESGQTLDIDLDERQWTTTYKNWMRRPGLWFLFHKEGRLPPLYVRVREGDQPYYTARHFGFINAGGGAEVTVYGIGVKRSTGTTERLWAFSTGLVAGGEDIEDYANVLLGRNTWLKKSMSG